MQDLQGNGFQQNLQYRGFDSSPLNGVPQGLAVYQNGVRINEAFGDIVNWDFLPNSAIEGITIVGANPVFGLNALGGAVTVLMRDGFSFQGTEIDVRGGSFGRVQGELATGSAAALGPRSCLCRRHSGRGLASVLPRNHSARLRGCRR